MIRVEEILTIVTQPVVLQEIDEKDIRMHFCVIGHEVDLRTVKSVLFILDVRPFECNRLFPLFVSE